MGYTNLLPMLRMRMKTKDIPYKQAMLAKHVKEVGAKGIDVDTASPLFIASLNCEPKQHDLRAAQTLDAIKCQLTDPETKSAVTGPGGTRLVVAVGCEIGVNKLKELTRVTSQSAALTAASDAARAGDFASARPTWEFVADRKLADCTMLQRFIPQDPFFRAFDIYIIAAPDESDAQLAADHDTGDPLWGLHLQPDGSWKPAPLPALARHEWIAVTNDLDVLGAGRRKHLHLLRSWRRKGYQIDTDELAATLRIHPKYHPLLQALLGADYYCGAMTPARALLAVDATEELRAPLAERLALGQVATAFMASYDEVKPPKSPAEAVNNAETLCEVLRCIAGLTKGHMVRGPVDGGVDALYFGPASNIFARDLAGKPMEDITYDKPIDAAGALLLITFRACVVAGELRGSSGAEALVRKCCSDLRVLWELYGERCCASDYMNDFEGGAFFDREDLFGRAGDFGLRVPWDVTLPATQGGPMKLSTAGPWSPIRSNPHLSPGLAALKYLDLGLGTRPEWAHSIAGTDKQLFSAPLTQRKWLLSFSSSLVCDLADFLWAQLADGVPGSVTTTPQYTMSFIKEAGASTGIVEHALEYRDSQGAVHSVPLKAEGWPAYIAGGQAPGQLYADISEPGFMTVPLAHIVRTDVATRGKIWIPSSAAGFFADAFLLGSGRTYTLVLDGCALFTVHLMRQTGPRAVQHQSMPISMELEAAAAALAAQAGPDAHLRCAQVLPGADVINAQIICDGAVVTGINQRKVQAAVADARKGPVLLSSNSCAWPLHRKYMLRLAAGEARRVYMEEHTFQALGLAGLQDGATDLAIDGICIPGMAVGWLVPVGPRGIYVFDYLRACAQVLQAAQLTPARAALMLEVLSEGNSIKALNFTGAALDEDYKLLYRVNIGHDKVIGLVEEELIKWRRTPDGYMSRDLDGLAKGSVTGHANIINMPKYVLTELGLGCPTHDNLKGTFGVDLGHAAFHWTVDFRYERMQPDPARSLYLNLQTHGLVQALERCIPVSPSKVKVLLKHVEGVLLLRLVHSELGTPVLPDWDKLRLALDGSCTRVYANVSLDQAAQSMRFQARLSEETISRFMGGRKTSALFLMVPVHSNMDLSSDWKAQRTSLGATAEGLEGGLTDCSTGVSWRRPGFAYLEVYLWNGLALAELLRAALADAGAAADGSTAFCWDSVAAGVSCPFYTSTFAPTCYLDMQALLGDPDPAGKRGIKIHMAIRDGKGGLLTTREGLVAAVRKDAGKRRAARGELALLGVVPSQASGAQAGGAPAEGDPAAGTDPGRRMSTRKRKTPAN